MKIAMSSFAVFLIGVLAWQWRAWPPAEPAAPEAPADALAPIAAPAGPASGELLPPPPPKEEYLSVKERPLFLPDRRPPPEEEPAEEAPTAPEVAAELDQLDLNAVLITPALVSAWVRAPSQAELVRLRLGDEFQGWTVQQIEPSRVVLERQGSQGALELRDYSKPQPVVRKTPLRSPQRQAPSRPAQTGTDPARQSDNQAPPKPTPADISARRDRASNRGAGRQSVPQPPTP